MGLASSNSMLTDYFFFGTTASPPTRKAGMLAEQAPTGAGSTFVASLLGHDIAILTLQGQDVNELSRLSFLVMLGGKCGSQAKGHSDRDPQDSPSSSSGGKLQTSKWLSCSLLH